MSEVRHAIKVVARATGLSPHVIRIWERRYRAVEPVRTTTNRRLYSEEQIERLALLHQLTRAGHSIGLIAKLTTKELRRMADENPQPENNAGRNAGGTEVQHQLLNECIEAVKNLDARGLETIFKQGTTTLGAQGLLQKVIAPLSQIIGDLWREGTITAAHEHFASAVIRVFLGQTSPAFAGFENAPVLVVATPTGQLHELGAMLVGAAAANLGWRVLYLGASLPAAEIAGAARQNQAKAIALSIVYPEDDLRLEGELKRLRELTPAETHILAGGRAMPSYRSTLEQIQALQIKDLTHFCSILDEIRRPGGNPETANASRTN